MRFFQRGPPETGKTNRKVSLHKNERFEVAVVLSKWVYQHFGHFEIAHQAEKLNYGHEWNVCIDLNLNHWTTEKK